jgi:hypothetical protein
MMEEVNSTATPVLIRAKRHNIPEDGILEPSPVFIPNDVTPLLVRVSNFNTRLISIIPISFTIQFALLHA